MKPCHSSLLRQAHFQLWHPLVKQKPGTDVVPVNIRWGSSPFHCDCALGQLQRLTGALADTGSACNSLPQPVNAPYDLIALHDLHASPS